MELSLASAQLDYGNRGLCAATPIQDWHHIGFEWRAPVFECMAELGRGKALERLQRCRSSQPQAPAEVVCTGLTPAPHFCFGPGLLYDICCPQLKLCNTVSEHFYSLD